MKLLRFGPPGREKPGILDAEGQIRDLSKVVPDLAGDALSPSGLAKIKKAQRHRSPHQTRASSSFSEGVPTQSV